MSPHIRLATLADAAGCLALYRPFVRDTAVSFETAVPTQAEFQARMAEVLQRTPWVVCEEQGRIVGYVYATRYRPRPAYQWSVETTVYLAEEARGRGLARALYGELLARLRGQGFVNAYAVITLPNPASVTLHERLGYRPLGVFQQVGYKLGRWHDVGWWHLQLQPPPTEPAAPTPPAVP